MRDLGIVDPGSTIYISFDSFGANGQSLTLTGLAVTDIEIYKNGSITQRSSDAGYALLDTDGIDFDGVTGIHGFSIDLADNTDAGFYAAGSHYRVVVSAVTINSQTVSFTAATFRIGYRDAVLNTTIATLASQTSFTLTAGPAEDDALNGCVVLIHDVASAVQKGFAVVSDYTGSTKTVTLTAGTTFTAAATDNISFFPPVNAGWGGSVAYSTTRGLAGTALPAAAADAAGGLPISDAGGLDLDAKIGALTFTVANKVDANATHVSGDSIAADTLELFAEALDQATGQIDSGTFQTGAITSTAIAQDAIGADELGADAIAEIADQVWDENLSQHLTAGSTGEALNAAGSAGDPWTTTLPGSYTGSQAGKMLSDILTDTGTTLQGELDGIQADTEDIQSRLPAALTAGGNIKADALAVSGDATAADTLELFAEALDQATGQIDSGSLASGTITAASIATGAVDADALATDAVDEIVDAVWDEVLTGATHNVSTSAGKRLRQISAIPMLEGTVNDVAPTSTSFATTLTGYGDNVLNDTLLMVEFDTGKWESKLVVGYTSATGTFTVDEAFAATISNGDVIAIQMTHIHPDSQIADAIWDEDLSGHSTAGTGGKLVTDANTAVTSGTHGNAALKTLIDAIDDYVDAEVSAIKAKTDQLTFTSSNKVDATLQAAADVATAVCQKLAHVVLRRTMANAEAASDGDTLDLSSLYGLVQMLQEASVSGTTLTIKQTNGSTTLGTKTLTTDASADPVTGIA